MRPLWAEARVPDTLREWIAPIVTLIGGTGLGALIQAVRKPSSKAEDVTAEAEANRSATDGFVALVKELREERRADRAELEQLKDEVRTLRKEHADCLRENAELRQEVADVKEELRELRAGQLSRDLAAAAEILPGTMAVIEDGRKTVIRPPRKPRKTQ